MTTPDVGEDILKLSRRYMRPPTAAKYVGLAEQTLAQYRSKGIGPIYSKVGRAVIYDRQNLDVFISDGLIGLD